MVGNATLSGSIISKKVGLARETSKGPIDWAESLFIA